ncbi:hypothetical protein HNR46_003641 [Haloferula luteola]|uniref:Uncharacterized protein n=1 Tax=Haloferula luteola TaxID=595692 RepID=A0A840VCY5_9BACT|nr:hypothetical protein [Haloferula luteola]
METPNLGVARSGEKNSQMPLVEAFRDLAGGGEMDLKVPTLKNLRCSKFFQKILGTLKANKYT